MTEQQKFDEDYRYVRMLLLRGNCKLNDAKLWLNAHGQRYEENLNKQEETNLAKYWSTNVDRDERRINKLIQQGGGEE